jgi:hypothetical protein
MDPASRGIVRRAIPWLPLFLASLLMAGGLALESLDGRGGAPTDPFATLVLMSSAAVGGLIASRHPRNAVAWLLDLMSIAMLGAFFVARYAVVGYDGVLPLPGIGVTGALGWVWVVGLICPVLIAYLVPTGRPASPRWALAFRGTIVVVVAVEVVFALGDSGYELVGLDSRGGFIPNPIYVPALAPAYDFVNNTYAIYLAVFVLGAAALVTRFRNSRGIERLQLKWVVVGIAAMIAFMAASQALPSPISDAFFTVAVALLPISLGMAILRYHLYDIDRIISRTVGYGLVTGLLAAVFAGGVLVFQGLLAQVTSGDNLSIAGSTLLVAALFQPLRRRIQAVVDRRFNRRRYDADRIVDEFGARLRDDLDIDTLADAIRAVALETVEPASAGVWLATGEAR